MPSPILSPSNPSAPAIPRPPTALLRIASTLFVDATNGSDRIGTRGTDLAYATIAQAYADSLAGDTIVLRGTFTAPGAVVIAKKLRIVGDGAKIVAQAGDDQKFEIVAAGSGTEIVGLEIDGNASPSVASYGMIQIGDGTSDVTVRDCYIHNTKMCGIYSHGTTPRLNILNNRIEDTAMGYGGMIAPNELVIQGNRISGGTNGGIRITYSGGGGYGYLIDGNTIKDSPTSMGIEIWGQHTDYVISNNRVFDCNFGISTDFGRNVTISGNVVKGSNFIGIEASNQGDKVTISGNALDGTDSAGTVVTDIGISMSGATVTNATVTGNTVKDCVQNMAFQGTRNISVTGNVIALSSYATGVYFHNARGGLVSGNIFTYSGSSAGGCFVSIDNDTDSGTRYTINANQFDGSPLFGIRATAGVGKTADAVLIVANQAEGFSGTFFTTAGTVNETRWLNDATIGNTP